MHCHEAHKVQFHENHLYLVGQTPQNHSAPGTRLGALLPHKAEVPIVALGMHNQGGKLGVRVLGM